MASEKLPAVKYHPDPVGTGSVVESVNACVCCGKKRGYIYAGPAFSEEDYEECICPWCIADGSAAEELGVTFQDEASIPGSSFGTAPEAVEAVREASGIDDEEAWEEFFDALDKDGSPTAYVFRCLHCRKVGAYQDCD